jgi:hypothetical protein
MTKNEALRMAIEAMELHGNQYPHMIKGYILDAIQACKEALAETQEPVLYIDGGGLDGHATWAQAIRCQATDIALYTHPAPQPPQEPVAWMHNGEVYLKKQCKFFSKDMGKEYEGQIPLYTTPPSREWQSLSDAEIEELYGDCSIEYFRDIEAKLREKNNGGM